MKSFPSCFGSAILGLWLYLFYGCLPAGAQSCLMPGDVAITRVQADRITLLALRTIPEGTTIAFTKRTYGLFGWESTSEPLSGVEFLWRVLKGGLKAGQQSVVEFARWTEPDMKLNWGDTLTLFTHYEKEPLFLFAVRLDRFWGLWSGFAPGLENGVSALVLGQWSSLDAAIDHVFEPSKIWSGTEISADALSLLISVAQSGLYWQKGALAATPVEQYKFLITEHPGVVAFTSPVFRNRPGESKIEVTLAHFLANTSQPVTVTVRTENQRPGFSEWNSVKPPYDDAIPALAHNGQSLVAVTRGGRILLSEDGYDWSAVHQIDGTWEDVLWAEEGGFFAAVGAVRSAFSANDWPILQISRDGRSWTSLGKFTEPGIFYTVVWDGESLLAAGDTASWKSLLYQVGYVVRPDGEVQTAILPTFSPLRTSAVSPVSDTVGGIVVRFPRRLLLAGDSGTVLIFNEATQQWTAPLADSPGLPTYRAAYFFPGSGFLVCGEEGSLIVNEYFLNKAWQIDWAPESVKENEDDPFSGGWLGNPVALPIDFLAAAISHHEFILGGGYGTVVSYKPALESMDPKALGEWQVRRPFDTSAAPILDFAVKDDTVFAASGDGLILYSQLSSMANTASEGHDFVSLAQSVTWAPGDTCPKTITIPLLSANTVAFSRKSFDLRMVSHTPGLYLLNDRAKGVIVYDDPARTASIQLGYGAIIRIVDVNVEAPVLSKGNTTPPTLTFRLQNTSAYSSAGGFLRFEGSNLPVFDIAKALPKGIPPYALVPGRDQPPLRIPLPTSVRAISYYERVNNGQEEVFHHRYFLNMTYNPPGNRIGSVTPPGLVTGARTLQTHGLQTHDGSGWVWYPPPDGTGGQSNFGIYLQSVSVQGPSTVKAGETAAYQALGTFYDPLSKTTFQEIIRSTWTASPPSTSIATEAGTLQSFNQPWQIYPINGPVKTASTDGAPVDLQGVPIPVYAEMPVSIIQEGRKFSQEVQAKGLSGQARTAPGDDYDGDGWANLWEYGLGWDWTTPNASWPLVPLLKVRSDQSQRYSFTRPVGLQGIRYRMEVSTDWQNWTEYPLQLDSASPSGWETWYLDLPGGAPRYARLRLSAFAP